MIFSSITFKGNDGFMWIRNWKYYFADLVRTSKYDWVESHNCPIQVYDNTCYILDRKHNIIWESGRKISEIEQLHLCAEEVLSYYVGFKYNELPRYDIGIQAAERYRMLLEAEGQKEIERMQNQEYKKMQEIMLAKPSNVHTILSGKEWLEKGANEKDKDYLWKPLWKDAEICFLFADSNIGKSIFAHQMAFSIAKHQKVIYFDYEMDCKDFQIRYTGPDGTMYDVPDNFIRSQADRDIFLRGNVENVIIKDIERIVETEDAKVIIIDNLTYINRNTQSTFYTSILMYKLKILQEKYGLAILLLAHTPKRNARNPITQNDLAGSKRLLNFADSCFAIGQSMMDRNVQYLKQIKSRCGKLEYDSENVLLMERVFSDNWLHFEIIGNDREENHLKINKQDALNKIKKKIVDLQEKGMTQREIANILEMSPANINRLIKQIQKDSQTKQIPQDSP